MNNKEITSINELQEALYYYDLVKASPTEDTDGSHLEWLLNAAHEVVNKVSGYIITPKVIFEMGKSSEHLYYIYNEVDQKYYNQYDWALMLNCCTTDITDTCKLFDCDYRRIIQSDTLFGMDLVKYKIYQTAVSKFLYQPLTFHK